MIDSKLVGDIRMTNPTFGEKEANVRIWSPLQVYAVIPDEKKRKVILVQAPNGAWFLPMARLRKTIELPLNASDGRVLDWPNGHYLGQADESPLPPSRLSLQPSHVPVTSFQEKPLEGESAPSREKLLKHSNAAAINGVSKLENTL